jgi:hypothetical protein
MLASCSSFLPALPRRREKSGMKNRNITVTLRDGEMGADLAVPDKSVGWVEPFARPNSRDRCPIVGSREELDPTYDVPHRPQS